MAKIKQKNLLSKIIANQRKSTSGKESFRKLAKESGYGESVSRHPTKFMKQISWKDLQDEYIPDEKILSRLGHNIDSKSTHGSNTAIDIALRVKGYYSPQKLSITEQDERSLEEIEKENELLKKQIRKRYPL